MAQAHAFTKNGEHRFTSQAEALKEAQKLGLGISNRERLVKNQIEKQNKRNPSWLSDRIKDSFGDPEFYRSYLAEVRDGRAQVETAKVIARLSLYKALKSNWEYVQTSILNRNGDETFEKYANNLKRDLEKLEYIPTKKTPHGYAFETVEWGRVIVARNEPSAKWSMDIASYLDGNVLEPGAEKIKIDKDSRPSFEPQEDERENDRPVVAPALAGSERKQIVPQLRKGLNKPSTGRQ
jgi:hypothetical protein